MSLPRPSRASQLATALDLAAAWNATDHDVAERFHPQYGPALGRLPEGAVVFRGLPFALGQRSSGRRWLLLEWPITVPFPEGRDRTVSHVVVAHFADSARDEHGERPPETPVGWVLPAGEPLARYDVQLASGPRRTLVVRRRFEIADGIIGWGFLPVEAVGHRADEVLDWRGPYPRQSPGRYPAAGQAGLLGMLPGSWGPTQTGVADFVPTADDDITYWLHALAIPPGEEPEAITLEPVDGGRPGSAGGGGGSHA